MVIYRIEESDDQEDQSQQDFTTFIDFTDKHFLQTHAWEAFQRDLGKSTVYKEENDYSYLGIVEKTFLGPYLLVPYGPYIDKKEAVESAYDSIRASANGFKAIFIRVQPELPTTPKFLNDIGAKKTHDINPSFTWAIDLKQDKAAIVAGFAQGTRTRYNTYASKGITVTTSNDPEDIKYLTAIQCKVATEKNFSTFSDEYLKTELKQPFATLYLVHYQDKVIAASLMFDSEDTRYYMQSATDPEYRNLPATVALLTTAIFDAQDKGLNTFDFWGVAPQNAPSDHPWAGFTAFKKSFGGYGVSYYGTYDIPLRKFKYSIYVIIRNLNRFKRRLSKQAHDRKAQKAMAKATGSATTTPPQTPTPPAPTPPPPQPPIPTPQPAPQPSAPSPPQSG